MDEDYTGKEVLHEFEEDHKMHPRQIVEERELGFIYENISQKVVERVEAKHSAAKAT